MRPTMRVRATMAVALRGVASKLDAGLDLTDVQERALIAAVWAVDCIADGEIENARDWSGFLAADLARLDEAEAREVG